jgi:transmembrane sensor
LALGRIGKRESAAEIDEAAAGWAARVDRAPLTPQEDAALDAWLSADIRRQGAYANARAILIRADRCAALGPDYDPKHFETPDSLSGRADGGRRPSRRTALMGGAAVAASVTAGLVGMILGRHYQTRRGEVRIVPLGDGSSMTLNTASHVMVSFSSRARDVRLLAGEALFDVAKNPSLPFVVDAGDVRVRVVGTSFTVRKMPGKATEVRVREGVVEVSRAVQRASAAVTPVRLIANQTVVAKPDQVMAPVTVEPAALARQLAWREGMIAFEAMSLKDATEEFARYSDPKIVVDDPALGDQAITGLFMADNPAGFAKSIAISLNLNAHTVGDEIHLSR